MYSIGKFSKLSLTSSKTLRYYDEISLLNPSYTDELTGYRYYDFKKFSELQRINLFKSLGVSLEDIRKIKNKDSIKISEVLEKNKKKLIESRRAIDEQINLIDDILKEPTKHINNDYEISRVFFKKLKPRYVLSIKDYIHLKDIDELVKRLFEKSYALKIPLTGNLMSLIESDSDFINVMIFMEVKDTKVIEENISSLECIKGGNYAYIYFKGLYSDLNYGYDKLARLNNNKSQYIEEYVDGLLTEDLTKPLNIRPNHSKDPNKFLTRIWTIV